MFGAERGAFADVDADRVPMALSALTDGLSTQHKEHQGWT
jgi:hypothetical protein